MTTAVQYVEPREHEVCADCRYGLYDSDNDELWCGHTPKPESLPIRFNVGRFGHCEYWARARDWSEIGIKTT